jgi:hypothetical protein
MTLPRITYGELDELLLQDGHPQLAERIRAGCSPVEVLGDGKGGARKAIRMSSSKILKDVATGKTLVEAE